MNADWLSVLEHFFVGYLALMAAGYLVLNLLSVSALERYVHRVRPDDGLMAFDQVAPPVSILVPAYNEEGSIVSSVRSLLQLTYPEFEIIVVNDGSKDGTLDSLIDGFQLAPIDEPHRHPLKTAEIRQIYRSRIFPNITVVDKQNGGKADALNAATNLARFPYLCSVDADSILQRDSMKRVMRAFLNDPTTIAAGGTIRIANGCRVKDGFLQQVGLPRSPLALFQIVEYFRAFLFGRMGWHPLNGLLIISGAFGVFRRDALERIGGYKTDTVGEDMDLVVRLHREYKQSGEPYRIAFVPDPICWTEAPEDVKTLCTQRARWQRGLGESLSRNAGLMFSRRGGAAGWLAYPFMTVFELLSPLVELCGYIGLITAWLTGAIDPSSALAFLALAVGLGVMLSVSALLLEEASFHLYQSSRQLWTLIAVAVIENFGYRQLVSAMRLIGFLKWATGSKASWGTMKRSGNWQTKAAVDSIEQPAANLAESQASWRSFGGERWRSLLAVSGALFLAMGLLWLSQEPEPLAYRIHSLAGTVLIDGAPGQADRQFGPEEQPRIQTRSDGLVTLEFEDGGTLQIAPNAIARVLSARRRNGGDIIETTVEVEQGEIERQVPASGRLTHDAKIVTPDANLGVRGTQFAVNVLPSATALSVSHGAVSIADTEGKTAQVSAGYGASVTPSGLQAVVALPQAPAPLSPPAGTLIESLDTLLQWHAEGPGPYLVELLSGQDPYSVVARALVSATQAQIPMPPADGEYGWRVRSTTPSGLRGLPSETQRIDVRLYRGRLREFRRAGDPMGALAFADAALKGYPDDVSLRVEIAALLSQTGNPARALRELNHALRLAPDDPEARLTRGRVLLDAGEADRSLADFDTVLAERPHDLAAIRGRADSLFRLGMHQTANAAYAQLVATNPAEPDHAMAASRNALAINAPELAARYLRGLPQGARGRPEVKRLSDEIERWPR